MTYIKSPYLQWLLFHIARNRNVKIRYTGKSHVEFYQILIQDSRHKVAHFFFCVNNLHIWWTRLQIKNDQLPFCTVVSNFTKIEEWFMRCIKQFRRDCIQSAFWFEWTCVNTGKSEDVHLSLQTQKIFFRRCKVCYQAPEECGLLKNFLFYYCILSDYTNRVVSPLYFPYKYFFSR